MARCFQGTPVYKQYFAKSAQACMARGGCGSCDRQVYYTGPCPPASAGSCRPCPAPSFSPLYAIFADSGEVKLSPGAIFPMEDTSYIVGPASFASGTVTLQEEGVYLAVYTITGTSEEAAAGAVALYRNGAPLEESARSWNVAQGGTVQVVGQAIVQARAGDQISLHNCGNLQLEGEPVAVLTIVRLA